MGMDVPPEVRTLFLVLTGEEWPQVDEDGLLVLGHAWGKAATRLRNELEPQVTDSVRSIRSSFFGAAEQGFADMMAPYSVDEPHYIESAAEQFDSANKFLGDTSVQVQYVKLISILSLIELLVEIVWALAVAPFFPSAMTWLAARMKIVGWLLDRLWGRLLIRIVTAEVMGMAFQVAMDAMVQAIQLANGSRKHWDAKLTIQALEVGALGGALGIPFQAIAERLGKALGDKLVKVFGKDAAKVSDAARKAIDDNITDLGKKPTKEIAEKIAIGIEKHAGVAARDKFLRHTGTHLVDTVQEGLHEAFTEGLYGAFTGQGFSFNPFSFTSGAFSGQTSLARRKKSTFATDLEARWQGEINARRPTRSVPNRSTVDDDSIDIDDTKPPEIKRPLATGTVTPPPVYVPPAAEIPPPAYATAASTGEQAPSTQPTGEPTAPATTTQQAPPQQAGQQPPARQNAGQPPPARQNAGQPPPTQQPPTQQSPGRQPPTRQQPSPQQSAAQPPGRQSTSVPTPNQQSPAQRPATQQAPAQQAAQRTSLSTPNQPTPNQPTDQQPTDQQPTGQQATGQQASAQQSASQQTPAAQPPGQQSGRPTPNQQSTQQQTSQPSASQQATQQSPGQQSPAQQSPGQQATQQTPTQQSPGQPGQQTQQSGQSRVDQAGGLGAQARPSTPTPATGRQASADATTVAAVTVAATTTPAPATPRTTRDTPTPGPTQQSGTPAPAAAPPTPAPSRFGPAPSTPDRPGVFVADRTDSTLVEVAGKVRVPPGFFAVVIHAQDGQAVLNGRTADRAAVVADILGRYRDWVAANGPAQGIVLLACGLGANPANGRSFAADLADGLADGETVLASVDDVFVDPDSGQVSTGRPTITDDGRIGWAPGTFTASRPDGDTSTGWTPAGHPDLDSAVRLAPWTRPPAPPITFKPGERGYHFGQLRLAALYWRADTWSVWRRSGPMQAIDAAVQAWRAGGDTRWPDHARNTTELTAIQTAIDNWRQARTGSNSQRRARVDHLRAMVDNALADIPRDQQAGQRDAALKVKFDRIHPGLTGSAKRIAGISMNEHSDGMRSYYTDRSNGVLNQASLTQLDAHGRQVLADKLSQDITINPGRRLTTADVRATMANNRNGVTGQTTYPELRSYLDDVGAGPVTRQRNTAAGFAPTPQPLVVGPTTITAHTDPTDALLPQRLSRLRDAVERVQGRGFAVPDVTAHLPKYGRSLNLERTGPQLGEGSLARAEYVAPGGIVMSPEGIDNPITTTNGGTDAAPIYQNLSTTVAPSGTGTVVHELGHMLHHTNDRAKFWDLNFSTFDGQAGAIAAKVSGYASNDPREFVAEVFLGLVYGRTYPADVMGLYARYGGAVPDRFIADPGDRQLVETAHAAQAPPGYFPAVLHGRAGEAVINGTPAARAGVIDRIVADYRAWVAAHGPANGIALLGCGLGAAPATPGTVAFAAELAARLGPNEDVLATAADVYVDPATGQVHSGRSDVSDTGIVTWTPQPFTTFQGGSGTAGTVAGWAPTNAAPDLASAVRLAGNQPAALPLANPAAPVPAAAQQANPAQQRTQLRTYAANWRQHSASGFIRPPKLRRLDDLVQTWHDGNAQLPGRLAENRADLAAIRTAVTDWMRTAGPQSTRGAAMATLSQHVQNALAEIGQAEAEVARRAQLAQRFRTIDPALAQYARRANQDVVESSPAHQAYLAARQAGQLTAARLNALDAHSQQRVADRLNTVVGVSTAPDVTAADVQRAMAASTNPVTGQTALPELQTYLANTAGGPLTNVTGPAATFAPQAQTHTVGGTTVTAHVDPTDPASGQRVTALLGAVDRVRAAGFAVPGFTAHLPRYGRSLAVTAAGAVARPGAIPRAEFIAPASVVLSPEGTNNPIARTDGRTPPAFRNLSTTLDPTGVGTVVHELGHFLHHRNDRAKFWDLNFAEWSGATAATAAKVSQYAADNPREFVAETFLGIVYGRQYPADVLALYADLGGAVPDRFIADPADLPLVTVAHAAQVPAGYFAAAVHGRDGEAVVDGTPADRAALIDRIVAAYRAWTAVHGPGNGIALLACGLGAAPSTPGATAFAADLAARLGPQETVLASADDVFVDPASGQVDTGRTVVGADGSIGWQQGEFTAFDAGGNTSTGWTPPGRPDLATAVRLFWRRPPTRSTFVVGPGHVEYHRQQLERAVDSWRTDSRSDRIRSLRLRRIDSAVNAWRFGGSRDRRELERNVRQVNAVRTALDGWQQANQGQVSHRQAALDNLSTLVDNALAEITPLVQTQRAQARLKASFQRIDPDLAAVAKRSVVDRQVFDPTSPPTAPFFVNRVGGKLAQASLDAFDTEGRNKVTSTLARSVAIIPDPGLTVADVQAAMLADTNRVTLSTTAPELRTYLYDAGNGPFPHVNQTIGALAATQQILTVGPATITTQVDPTDQLLPDRINRLTRAMERITGRGFTLPHLTAHLPKYGRSMRVAPTGANEDGALGASLPRAEYMAPGAMMLSPVGIDNPIIRSDRQDSSGAPIYHVLSTTLEPDGTGSVVHEFGHHLHHLRDRGTYWDLSFSTWAGRTQREIAAKVSGYAAGNPREFVAEVFTGLVYGRTYPADVMGLYRALAGPVPERFIGDPRDRPLVAAAHAARPPAGYFPAVLHGRDGEALINGSPADRTQVIDRIVQDYRNWAAGNPRARGIALLACGLGAAPSTPGGTAFAADLAARLGRAEAVLASAADVFVDPATGAIHSGQSQVSASGTITWTPADFTTFRGGRSRTATPGATGLPSTNAQPAPGAVRLAPNGGTVANLSAGAGPAAPTARQQLTRWAGESWRPASRTAGPRNRRLGRIDQAISDWLDGSARQPDDLAGNRRQLRRIERAAAAWLPARTDLGDRGTAVADLLDRVGRSLDEITATEAARARQADRDAALARLDPALDPYVERAAGPADETLPAHQALLAGRDAGGRLGDTALDRLDDQARERYEAALDTEVGITRAPGAPTNATRLAMNGQVNELTRQSALPELASYLAATTASPGPAGDVRGRVSDFAGQRSQHQVGGTTVTFYSDAGDTHRAQREAAVRRAVDRIARAGVQLPPVTVNLPTYGRSLTLGPTGATERPGVPRAAFHPGAGLVLSPESHANPVTTTDGAGRYRELASEIGAAEVATQVGPADLTVHTEAVAVRELGRLAHHAHNRQAFADLTLVAFRDGARQVAAQVSEQAARGPHDFVAEVFLGLVWGRTFSPAVMTMYAAFGGPPVGAAPAAAAPAVAPAQPAAPPAAPDQHRQALAAWTATWATRTAAPTPRPEPLHAVDRALAGWQAAAAQPADLTANRRALRRLEHAVTGWESTLDANHALRATADELMSRVDSALDELDDAQVELARQQELADNIPQLDPDLDGHAVRRAEPLDEGSAAQRPYTEDRVEGRLTPEALDALDVVGREGRDAALGTARTVTTTPGTRQLDVAAASVRHTNELTGNTELPELTTYLAQQATGPLAPVVSTQLPVQRHTTQVGTTALTTHEATGDRTLLPRLAALHLALARIQAAGFQLPALDVHLPAFGRDITVGPGGAVTLGPGLPPVRYHGGAGLVVAPELVANPVTTQRTPGTYDHLATNHATNGSAEIVHELGQALHHAQNRNAFHELATAEFTAAARATAATVGVRAARSPRGFVGEVFLGMIHGQTFGQPVLDLYDAYGGPRPTAAPTATSPSTAAPAPAGPNPALGVPLPAAGDVTTRRQRVETRARHRAMRAFVADRWRTESALDRTGRSTALQGVDRAIQDWVVAPVSDAAVQARRLHAIERAVAGWEQTHRGSDRRPAVDTLLSHVYATLAEYSRAATYQATVPGRVARKLRAAPGLGNYFTRNIGEPSDGKLTSRPYLLDRDGPYLSEAALDTIDIITSDGLHKELAHRAGVEAPAGLTPARIRAARDSRTNAVTGRTVYPELDTYLHDVGQGAPATIQGTARTFVNTSTQVQVGGTTLTIHHHTNDPSYNARLARVVAAVTLISVAGYRLPALHIVLPKYGRELRVDADGHVSLGQEMHRSEFHPPATVVLSPATFLNPLTQQIGDDFQFLSTEVGPDGTASVVHEIGHALHYAQNRALFGDLRSAEYRAVGARVAAEVSGYAGNNPREFVAEVFLGLIYNRPFSRRVMSLYDAFGGPRPDRTGATNAAVPAPAAAPARDDVLVLDQADRQLTDLAEVVRVPDGYFAVLTHARGGDIVVDGRRVRRADAVATITQAYNAWAAARGAPGRGIVLLGCRLGPAAGPAAAPTAGPAAAPTAGPAAAPAAGPSLAVDLAGQLSDQELVLSSPYDLFADPLTGDVATARPVVDGAGRITLRPEELSGIRGTAGPASGTPAPAAPADYTLVRAPNYDGMVRLAAEPSAARDALADVTGRWQRYSTRPRSGRSPELRAVDEAVAAYQANGNALRGLLDRADQQLVAVEQAVAAWRTASSPDNPRRPRVDDLAQRVAAARTEIAAVTAERARVARLQDRLRQVAPALRRHVHRGDAMLIETDPIHQAQLRPRRADGLYGDQTLDEIDAAEDAALRGILAESFTLDGDPGLTPALVRQLMADNVNSLSGQTLYPELAAYSADRAAGRPARLTGTAGGWTSATRTFGRPGEQVTVHYDPTDPLLQPRLQALGHAVERVTAAGFTVPDLTVHLPRYGRGLDIGTGAATPTGGGPRRAEFHAPATIVATPQIQGNPMVSTFGTGYRFLSTTVGHGHPHGTETASLVHEIGHHLHHAQSRRLYWELRQASFTNEAEAIAIQVSGYATQSPREFVAEVFLGLMYGRTFPPEVLTLYRALGGPRPGRQGAPGAGSNGPEDHDTGSPDLGESLSGPSDRGPRPPGAPPSSGGRSAPGPDAGNGRPAPRSAESSQARSADWSEPLPTPVPQSAWRPLLRTATVSTVRTAPRRPLLRTATVSTVRTAPERPLVAADRRPAGPEDGPIGYDVADVVTEQGTVRAHRIRLFAAAAGTGGNARPTPAAAADRAAFDARARAGVDEHLNLGYRLPGGQQFHLDVEFVSDPTSAHAIVELSTEPGSTSQLSWHGDATGADLARELLRFLGVED
jgi:hypothetical protein